MRSGFKQEMADQSIVQLKGYVYQEYDKDVPVFSPSLHINNPKLPKNTAADVLKRFSDNIKASEFVAVEQSDGRIFKNNASDILNFIEMHNTQGCIRLEHNRLSLLQDGVFGGECNGVSVWCGTDIPATKEVILLGEMGGRVHWSSSREGVHEKTFELKVDRSLKLFSPGDDEDHLVLSPTTPACPLFNVQHYQLPCLFSTDLELATAEFKEQDARRHSDRCLVPKVEELGKPLAINCEWHTVTVFGWPHILLTSIPGVSIHKDDQLVANWGHGWFLAYKVAFMQKMQDSILKYRHKADANKTLKEMLHSVLPEHPSSSKAIGGSFSRNLCGVCSQVPRPGSIPGGRLLTCDGCHTLYHLRCLGLCDDFNPSTETEWFCFQCHMLANRIRSPTDRGFSASPLTNQSAALLSRLASTRSVACLPPGRNELITQDNAELHASTGDEFLSAAGGSVPTCPIPGNTVGVESLKPCRSCFISVGRHCDIDLHVSCRLHKAHLSPDFDEEFFGASMPIELRARRTIYKLTQALQAGQTENVRLCNKNNFLKRVMHDYKMGWLEFKRSDEGTKRRRLVKGSHPPSPRSRMSPMTLVKLNDNKDGPSRKRFKGGRGSGKHVPWSTDANAQSEVDENDSGAEGSDHYASCKSSEVEEEVEPIEAVGPVPTDHSGGTAKSVDSRFDYDDVASEDGNESLDNSDTHSTASTNSANTPVVLAPRVASQYFGGADSDMGKQAPKTKLCPARLQATAMALQPFPPGIIWARTTTRWFAVYSEGGRKRFKTFDPKRNDFGGNVEGALNAATEFLKAKTVWQSGKENAGDDSKVKKKGKSVAENRVSVRAKAIEDPDGDEMCDGCDADHSDTETFGKSKQRLSRAEIKEKTGSPEAGTNERIGFDSDLALARMEKEVASLPLEGHEFVRWYRSKRGFYASVGPHTKWFSAFQRGVHKAWCMANSWVDEKLGDKTKGERWGANTDRSRAKQIIMPTSRFQCGEEVSSDDNVVITSSPFSARRIQRDVDKIINAHPEKRLERGICWVSQKSTFSVFYWKNGARTTKSFNPSSIGDVKTAYRLACEFNSLHNHLKDDDEETSDTQRASAHMILDGDIQTAGAYTTAQAATSPLSPHQSLNVKVNQETRINEEAKECLPYPPGVSWDATQKMWTVHLDNGEGPVKTFPTSLYGSVKKAFNLATSWRLGSSLAIPKAEVSKRTFPLSASKGIQWDSSTDRWISIGGREDGRRGVRYHRLCDTKNESSIDKKGRLASSTAPATGIRIEDATQSKQMTAPNSNSLNRLPTSASQQTAVASIISLFRPQPRAASNSSIKDMTSLFQEKRPPQLGRLHQASPTTPLGLSDAAGANEDLHVGGVSCTPSKIPSQTSTDIPSEWENGTPSQSTLTSSSPTPNKHQAQANQ
eukprot:GHVN01083336.1.p1 GENE.GHVN01083336.1~~GHVN01083336.1.p1  ORF type:complete len:1403 (+),score=198.33 GHVN01083336.1:66-4274(+)